MRASAALRYSVYVSFIFALLCTIPLFGPFTGIFACCTALWTVVCIIDSKIRSPFARAAVALLSCGAVFSAFWNRVAENPVAAVITAAVGIAFTVFMGLGRFDVEYWRFRRTFIKLLSISAFITALNIIVFIAVEPAAKAMMDIEGNAAFTFICALIGVFVLSELRKGDADAKWKAMNAGRITAIVGIVSAALIVLYLILAFAFSKITPIVGRIAQRIQPNYAKYESTHLPYSQASANPTGQGEVKDQLEDREIMIPAPDEEDEVFPWWIIAVSSTLLAALLLYLVIRHRKRKLLNPDQMKKGDQDNEANESDEVTRIRAAYRKYIAFVKEKGGELTKGSTSEDILESSEVLSESTKPLEQELRDIYIKARYANSADVTKEDVERALELLEKILAEGSSDTEKPYVE